MLWYNYIHLHTHKHDSTVYYMHTYICFVENDYVLQTNFICFRDPYSMEELIITWKSYVSIEYAAFYCTNKIWDQLPVKFSASKLHMFWSVIVIISLWWRTNITMLFQCKLVHLKWWQLSYLVFSLQRIFWKYRKYYIYFHLNVTDTCLDIDAAST